MNDPDIKIREIETFAEFGACLDVQREVFGFPDLEISPSRHLIVTKHAGGFTLGAFDGRRLIGFALTVPAFRGRERIYYSHMACVLAEYQSHGVGARLKWAQRERALAEGVTFIKWTFQPVQARNAFFNLEKLGVVVRRYLPNYYGTGFSNTHDPQPVDSDRLFAEWELDSPKVSALAKGADFAENGRVVRTIGIPSDWNKLLSNDARAAAAEQSRIKDEFQKAFAEGLVCRAFSREDARYLLFEE